MSDWNVERREEYKAVRKDEIRWYWQLLKEEEENKMRIK